MKPLHLYIATRLLKQLANSGITGHLENSTLVVIDNTVGFRRVINLNELIAPDSRTFQSEVVYFCARQLIKEHRHLANLTA